MISRSARRPSGRKAPTGRNRRIGVVDIGSNSIRLVIYDCSGGASVPIFNEKVVCALGRSLRSTGRLDPRGVGAALVNLRRFAAVLDSMNVSQYGVLGTAAVRDAADGTEFVAEIRRHCGLKIEVLSGAEEATLGARGVLAGMHKTRGIVGDLGGGSLELTSVADGHIAENATLPLGPLRLMEAGTKRPKELGRLVDRELDRVDWWEDVPGRSLYLVGGAWRALARINMHRTDYPVPMVHHYALSLRETKAAIKAVLAMTPAMLAKTPDLARNRIEAMPYAAVVLRRLLERVEPKRVVFSAYGLREGYVYSRLTGGGRNPDRFLLSCEEMARRVGRFQIPGAALSNWIQPLFAHETAEARRLRLAACHLSDIGWADHPEERGDQALYRVLRAPFPGLDHVQRAALALAVHRRYGGSTRDARIERLMQFAGESAVKTARLTGSALRLAHGLAGGDADVLAGSRVILTPARLTLAIARPFSRFLGDVVDRRLAELAGVLGRPAVVRVEGTHHGRKR